MWNLPKYIKQTHLTTHSCKRFWKYAEEKEEVPNKDWTIRKIRKLIAKAIRNEIRSGLIIDRTGCFHVPIGWGLYAAVTLSANGYLAITIHKNEYKIDIKKLREQHKKKEERICE